jgi:hypothetical protein
MGSSAMLHRLNPVRLAFIRDARSMRISALIQRSFEAAGGQKRARRRLRCGAVVQNRWRGWGQL